jgi:hypothetical protein
MCRTVRLTDGIGVGDTREKEKHDKLERSNQTSCRDLWSGSYLEYVLSRLSLRDQNVDGIACGHRVPPGLDIRADHEKSVDSGHCYFHPSRAGEPRQNQGGGGGTS